MPAIGDFMDLIDAEGYRAVTYDPDEAGALVAALGRILNDAALREELGRANLAASERFTMDDVADRYVSEFVKVMAQRRGR